LYHVGSREQDRKLLAAQPGNDRMLVRQLAEQPAEMRDDAISGRMTKLVVYRFEMVEIPMLCEIAA
jgi:hypothetical protein